MLLVLLVISISLGLYFLKRNYEYWQRLGVPGPEPRFLVGNMWESFIFKKSIGEVLTDIYKKYKSSSIVGVFKGSSPCLMICDPEMIKEILVKEFSSFHDNDFDLDPKVDPMLGRNPFFIRGERWKTVRTQLTPCFTSGKMKSIFPLIEDNCKKFVEFIDKSSKLSKDGLEAKELFGNYTINNVSSCAFGLEGKCFEEPENEFKQLASAFLSPGGWMTIKFFLISLIPPLGKILSIKFASKEAEDTLSDMVGRTVKYRKDNNVVRNDFLNILIQLNNSSENDEFSDIDISAHAAGFILDGYESSSVVMSFFLFELAANQEAQKKLLEEINERFEKHGGKLTYEEIQDMPYLDAAFNESQRMHPAIFTIAKRCTKPYTYIPKPNDGITKPVTIEAGTSIILPVHGIQNDPRFYENPDKYIPERFLDANKDKIVKYTFFPFGEGPRACIGQRFGTLQVKAGIAYIIRNFELSVNPKTQRPLKFDPIYFLPLAVGGLWIDFKRL